MASCGTAVQNALRGVPGVQSAVVDFPSATATVVAAEDVNINALAEAVEAVGFEAAYKPAAGNVTYELDIGGMMWYESIDMCTIATTCLPKPSYTHSFRSMKNCGNAVQNVLRQVDGVDSAIVDFPSRLATVVVSDPSVDGAQLCDAVEMIGFDASLKASHQAPTVPSTIPLRIGGMSWYALRSAHMASAVLCCCSRCCAPAPTSPLPFHTLTAATSAPPRSPRH